MGMEHPKKIGFLSFGAWHPGGGSTHSAGDALRQTVELAVTAEQIGIDGAFVRVHHFARQLSSPFPLLTAIGVSTSRIEIGTGVIDMRYENPLYMAEEASAADLLASGRLQLGVSRGSPEPAWHGAEVFGYSLDREQAREKTALFRKAIAGAGVVRADIGGRPGEAMLAVQPQSPGLADRIWWGSGTRQSAVWAGEQGLNLMSSTLLLEDTQVPFDQLQAEQISLFREAWTNAGHPGEPRVSISRSVMPITSDLDRRYFGGDANESVGSTAQSAASAAATPVSPTGSLTSWHRTPPFRSPTPSCSRCRANSVSTTTRRCWKRSPATSRPLSAGARTSRTAELYDPDRTAMTSGLFQK
jgi:alkanesulfonate monooxygenase SsuD/methylene tetrahydromethanopterin reductase-like flavin-dependent oxidoreductase (luciferase family)